MRLRMPRFQAAWPIKIEGEEIQWQGSQGSQGSLEMSTTKLESIACVVKCTFVLESTRSWNLIFCNSSARDAGTCSCTKVKTMQAESKYYFRGPP